jgi:hypothetical protein
MIMKLEKRPGPMEAVEPVKKSDRVVKLTLISSWCRGKENVDLYIHFTIRLHGVVLN